MARRGVGPSGWRPAVVLTAIVLVDAMDQGVVPGTLSLLQDEWGFSDTLGGAIPTAALIVGVLALVPAGWMADHLRRTRLLTIVIASWAVLSGLSALSVSFLMFFVVRMALGGASSIDNPVSSSLLADFYPPLARGRVFAVQRLSVVVGTGIGIGLGGALGEWLGWRAAYLAVVIPGFVVALLVATLHEPTRGGMDDVSLGGADPAVPHESPAAVLEEIEETAPHFGEGGVREYLREFRGILDIATVRTVFFGLAVTVLGFNGIAFWLPSYLERDFDLSEGQAAAVTALVAVTAGIIGAFLGGTVGDRAEARRTGARIGLTGFALIGGASLLVIGFAVQVLVVTAVVVCAGATLLSFAFPNMAAAAAEVLPARRRGTGFAVFGFLLTLGSAAGPLVIGTISEISGSLQLAIILAVLPALPGALVVLRGRRTFAADVAAARVG
ncbi:MAG: MFS transporter [Actinobacteria bacterium]|nr:MFS transporter [Actinomycetota bacterium]